MINAIIRFSVSNKLLIGLMVLGLIIAGIRAVQKLPIDAVPDITNNQVLIITSSPSLSAPDIERQITIPLEQATRNIPGMIEQRSFSRFGLSLITLVFEDDVDVYWARQQVSEKINNVKQQFPPNLGTPELAPVSTGLGEIYQYVIKPKKGFEHMYSLTDLRTIQDWIVRKQLLGTPGVADVSSFGGKLKQYQVSIDNNLLNSFQIHISDVCKALEENNSNAGGSYIEKGPNALFIRTEGLLANKEEIENIVIKHKANERPITIKEIATVEDGFATRYGATVYNAEGEVAGAVVMMLKGANSNEVIKNIKSKISEIQKTLPVGVEIEPFLDRSKMVKKAIETVEVNLLEGALIVVFVLVFFLGNLRAGLIVASVIPLSLLFAIILMHWMGLSGNLMSLGALDFGLIVDGAVIIVEAVMHQLHIKQKQKQDIDINATVTNTAASMMNIAVYGQFIILIVYSPILALKGIEGKMFTPMALTVSFALIGAFILSITYVPMLSALVLKKIKISDNTWSDQFIRTLQAKYKLGLQFVINHSKTALFLSVALFMGTSILFYKLGGEFIPELEEGDFAVDTRLLTGSSLHQTIKTTQQTANLLLKNFPEVEKIVTKIGSGEIPTDPMPIEAADMMVILKDKKEWTSAKTFEELANKMSDQLASIPGITTGFQFPVQMRFNELMTGSRQDVVCKIFGSNLDTLAWYANQIGTIAHQIQGATDLYIETVSGIPQLVIKPNRVAMAQYGVSMKSLNQTIQTAYAGYQVGEVYEEEKRFDIIVKLKNEQRNNIESIEQLLIKTESGNAIPLYMVAKVEIVSAPYQIQRENTQRRITIGLNVRNRDVESLVNELEQMIRKKIVLPAGYYLSFGGQYENLNMAKNRLRVALPVALILIFALLYFAFNNLKDGLIIFSAIPLAAIGGVWALWMRDMPFSISAGIGFIALFGVAVLNGMVLMAEIHKELKVGAQDFQTAVLQACISRLRPVLMTALVASLGFIPMALSNGAGAEVQKPLATVVIGGLITATVLTLFILPILVLLFKQKKITMKKSLISFLVLLVFKTTTAQESYDLKKLQQRAIEVAPELLYGNVKEQQAKILSNSTSLLQKTNFNFEVGNVNSAFLDQKISLIQSFNNFSEYRKTKQIQAYKVKENEWYQHLKKKEITLDIDKLYYTYLHYKAVNQSYTILKNSFQKLISAINQRKKTGEIDGITEFQNLQLFQKIQIEYDLNVSQQLYLKQQLAVYLQLQDNFFIEGELLFEPIIIDTTLISLHPELQKLHYQKDLAIMQTAIESAKLTPDWSVGIINQSFVGWQADKAGVNRYYDGSKRFLSAQITMSVPIFNKPIRQKVKAATIEEQLIDIETSFQLQQLKLQLNQTISSYNKSFAWINWYNANLKQALPVQFQKLNDKYENGEINYLEWSTSLKNLLELEMEYYNQLLQFNLAKAQINYLLN